MNPKLPALLAAELDSIEHDTDRARRTAELLRAMAESFPTNYDCNGYRSYLLNSALDLECDADTMDSRMAESLAEDDYMQRLSMFRRAGAI